MINSKSMKNGEIELLRFIFSIIIVLFHSKFFVSDNKLVIGGALSVEFFFLVSGYLMAQTIENKRLFFTETKAIGKETFAFVLNKASKLYPEFFVSWVIGFIVVSVSFHANIGGIIDLFFRKLWDLLFLNMSGLGDGTVNEVTWYISSMLLCMTILYPLIKKYKDVTVHIFLPLFSVVCFGYMYQNYGHLHSPQYWNGCMYKGNVRAFAELSLGVLVYYGFTALRQIILPLWMKAALTLAKYISIGAYIAYMLLYEYSQWDFAFCLIMAITIGIIFQRINLDNELFQNCVCFLLGRISIPLYFSHLFWAYTLNEYFGVNLPDSSKLLIYCLLTAITSCIVMFLSNLIRKSDFIGRIKKSLFI